MKKYCPYCKKESINRHVEYCKDKPVDITRTQMRIDFLKYNFPEMTKYRLQKDYIINRMSLTELKNKYSADFKATQTLLVHYGLKIRDIKESSDIMLKNSKKTFQRKYGVDNVWEQGAIGYENRIKNLNKKYGVDNVFQLPEVIDKIKVSNANGGHEKRKRTMREKYGYVSSFQDPEIHAKALENSAKRITKLNKKIYDVLDKNNIKYETEFYINENGKKYFYDAKVKNLIIEINGDYWHANPDKYDERWINKQRNMSAKDIWEYDENKMNAAKNNGFDVYVIWENEINKNKDNIIYENIKDKIS